MEIDADIIQPEDHDRRRSKNASLAYITLVILLISLMLLLCIHVICIYWTVGLCKKQPILLGRCGAPCTDGAF